MMSKFFFFQDFIYLLLKRGEGREKERERNINVFLPLTGPPPCTTTQACALIGKQPFGFQADTQTTEPHQLGLKLHQHSLVTFSILTKNKINIKKFPILSLPLPRFYYNRNYDFVFQYEQRKNKFKLKNDGVYLICS